jgi:starvation-inducible DNA-binding protein
MAHIHNDGHNPKLQVFIQPNIGLDSDVRHSVVGILNMTLANEAVLTEKTRSAYWNVSGSNILDMQNFFKKQLYQLNKMSDEIAERVRMLGGFAIGSFQEFLKFTQIEEKPGIVVDLLSLLADHESSIRFIREDARKCTEEYEDEGTFELLVSVMRIHEKIAWMLRSHIEPELTISRNEKA